MRSFLIFGLAAAGIGALLIPACGDPSITPTLPTLDGGLSDGGPVLRGVGDTCDATNLCRPNLTCTAGTCAPGRSAESGAACTISAECKDTLYCAPGGKCAAAGAGDTGATCGSDAECKSGLRCNVVGFGAECQAEGTKDIGKDCTKAGDCYGGLLCAPSAPGGPKVCAPIPGGDGPPPLAIPGFRGVECEEETGPVTAHFTANNPKDYFRLPFPNDIRLKNGKPDLTGFPTPGDDLLGFDLVKRWADYLQVTGTGWSAYPTVTFRFSGEFDFESLKAPDGQPSRTHFIDISEGEGNEIGHNWSGTTGRTQYVCPNGVSFRPRMGEPLKPGHTYAVMMSTDAKTKDGTVVAQSEDFKKVIGAQDPGGDLSAAWKAYQPLRTWATSGGRTVDLTKMVNASVFTVGQHRKPAQDIAAEIAKPATTVTSTGWVKCGDGADPCAQNADNRACPAQADPAFDEYHGLVTLPNFQKGNAPYLTPADNGDVVDANNAITLNGTVQACAALTIPKTPNAASYPIVIYAHGTGGSHRSHINEGVAGRMAAKGVAVLGIDQVGHGTRRGTSDAKPEGLFFNFTNPAAARGNVLQGAADQLALVKLAATLNVGTKTFTKIAYWGHSQGATEGSIAMPYSTNVRGVVLSGAGGSLIHSLLNKKSPVNIAAVAPAVLSELPGAVVDVHPALGMFQNAIDPADPLDHAENIAATGRHVFVPYGQQDTYSPPVTEATYVFAARLEQASLPAGVTTDEIIGAYPSRPVPVTGNRNGTITAVFRQYAKPAASDGHFVATKDTAAIANVDEFLEGVLIGELPAPSVK